MPNKAFGVFSREISFKKAIQNFFPVFEYPDINTRSGGRILDSHATLDFVSGLHHCLEFSQPLPGVYIRLCKHGKRFLLLKIAKILRALWLAELLPRGVFTWEYVHKVTMAVTSRFFAFRARIWNRFWVEKLDKFTLFTHFLFGWNLENRYKEGVSIFFAWADILSEKNPYFEKHSKQAKTAKQAKTGTYYAYKLRV